MKRIRVPLVTGVGGIQAAMPTFTEVPGSYQPIVPGVIDANGILPGVALNHPALANATVLVDVPDEDAADDLSGANPRAIARKYPDHFLVRNGTIK